MRVFKLGVCALAVLVGGCQFDASGGAATAPPGTTGGNAGTSTGGVSGSGGISGSGGSGGSSGFGGSGSGGSGGSGGMMMPDASVDALMTSGGCSLLGQRACVDSTHSGTCQILLGGILGPSLDRTCPPRSFCQQGYCRPPGGTVSCATDRQCPLGTVCNVYVRSDNNTLIGACTDPFPSTSLAGADCSSGDACSTGFCAQQGQNTPQCLGLCVGDADCAAGAKCKGISSPTSVEGASMIGIKSCFGGG